MAIYFSEKFKQNRKAKDLTQEQLAEIFHVSPQAISRWEIGATCPDIELLPVIASYFNITVDELLGVDKIKDKARIEEIQNEMEEKWKNGHMNDAVEMLRNAVREFPHEYKLQLRLATSLYLKYLADIEENKDNLPESITILERILENSTDDDTRNGALFDLSQCYKQAGNKDKAVETAKKLSLAHSSSNVVLAQIYEGDELREQLKKNIATFTQFLADNINKLANSMYNSGSSERIELINKAIGILDLIYENGDYGFDNFDLSRYYFELAKNYYGINDMGNALSCLEKAAQHAVDFDALADFKQHTSLAVQGLGETRILIKGERNKNNQCYDMQYVNLAYDDFDLIKDDERYKAVISKLEKHAKSY
ncbi:MAG: helix-turn-helix domain-containing protein [Oscillospiraceae bacterium]|nr:helix-turn-helix domain-containing protein [Oscillospiraceae bacterium]